MDERVSKSLRSLETPGNFHAMTKSHLQSVAYPRILFVWGGGIQQIQLRTEDRENGDLGG